MWEVWELWTLVRPPFPQVQEKEASKSLNKEQTARHQRGQERASGQAPHVAVPAAHQAFPRSARWRATCSCLTWGREGPRPRMPCALLKTSVSGPRDRLSTKGQSMWLLPLSFFEPFVLLKLFSQHGRPYAPWRAGGRSGVAQPRGYVSESGLPLLQTVITVSEPNVAFIS